MANQILAHLNTTGLAAKDPQLYQVLKELIEASEPKIPAVISASKFLSLTPVTFDKLPTLITAGSTIAAISDSTVNTWGTIIAGGGAFLVLGWFNGTDWTVIGI